MARPVLEPDGHTAPARICSARRRGLHAPGRRRRTCADGRKPAGGARAGDRGSREATPLRDRDRGRRPAPGPRRVRSDNPGGPSSGGGERWGARRRRRAGSSPRRGRPWGERRALARAHRDRAGREPHRDDRRGRRRRTDGHPPPSGNRRTSGLVCLVVLSRRLRARARHSPGARVRSGGPHSALDVITRSRAKRRSCRGTLTRSR